MFKLSIIVSLVISVSACGGSAPTPQDIQASTRESVPCEQSNECMQREAAGEVIAQCNESLIGNPAVMMSTWDNGATWVNGNCDSTAF